MARERNRSFGPSCNLTPSKQSNLKITNSRRVHNSVFSHDVTTAILVYQNNETVAILVYQNNETVAILVYQNNETVAMLVSQTNPVGVELFSCVKTFFCSNKFSWLLAT